MKIEELVILEDRYATGKYVAFRLAEQTRRKLLEFVEDLDIPGRLESDTWHVTLIMSQVDFPWTPAGHMSSPIKIDPKTYQWEVFPRFDEEGNMEPLGSLVLRFSNGYLDHRYNKAVEAGGVSNFPEYKQHVSMSYTFPMDKDISTLPLPKFSIKLASEYQEPLTQ